LRERSWLMISAVVAYMHSLLEEILECDHVLKSRFLVLSISGELSNERTRASL
jgi:hypothetical protein